MIKKITRAKPQAIAGLLLYCMLQFSYSAFAQEPRLDSLKHQIQLLKPNLTASLKDSVYVELLNDLAFDLRFNNRDSLRSIAEETLQYSKDIKFIKGEIDAYIILGTYHSDNGNHEKGVESILIALEKSKANKLYDLELRAISHLAILHDYLDENELALKEMLEGIDLATTLNNEEYLSIFNMNIGGLYVSLNEYHEGVNYLNRAKKFAEGSKDEMLVASINSNLASGYNYINQHEIALKVIDDAISTFEKNKTTDWLAFAYTIKGDIYLQKSDYQSASDWLKKGEKLYAIIDDGQSETILLVGLAKSYKGLKKDSIATVKAKRAFELADIFKDKEHKKKASELLYELHKKKNNLVESFKYLEIFQQLSDSLAQDESKKSLLMLKTQMDYDQQKHELIENNEKAINKQSNIIAGILTLVLCLSIYILLVLRNQKIQKHLNLELEKSKSELTQINETKTKLFSIISHDLKGPIGAFSKLIELFNQREIEKDQFMSFMPKLETDIKSISFTLNNLLSWGRTQMNGATTKPARVDVAEIVVTNMNLLSEIANKKSIKVINKVKKPSIVWSDRDQLDVIIRNLLSNALKFTSKNGSVTIGTVENDKNLEVSIQDTGIGMDQQTQNNIFDYNSTITTYGTNNEKGTGLGIRLCKELVKNNKGTIWVNSVLNEGTCFTFSLPKSSSSEDLT